MLHEHQVGRRAFLLHRIYAYSKRSIYLELHPVPDATVDLSGSTFQAPDPALCRTVSFTTKSPWFNPIQPRWLHAKRGVCEPDSELTPNVSRKRLCDHFDTTPLLNSFKIDDL